MNRTACTLLLPAALPLPSAAASPARAQAPATPAETLNASPARKKEEKKEEAPRRYETVRFESRLVGAPLPYNVIPPADYRRGSSKHGRHPVLYLLHGLAWSAENWVSSRARLADHAAPYPFIVVVPEGRDGWHTDSATVPNEKFESYFVEELIPDVGRRFRNVATREGRAPAPLPRLRHGGPPRRHQPGFRGAALGEEGAARVPPAPRRPHLALPGQAGAGGSPPRRREGPPARVAKAAGER